MRIEIPGSLLIIGYKEVFGENPPDLMGRISFLEGIDKNAILHELASLNLRQLPPMSMSINDGETFQMKMFEHLSGKNTQVKKPYLITYDKTGSEIRDKGIPIFFSRTSTLFAIQEIITHYNPTGATKKKLNTEDFAQILQYYSCVNSVLADYNKSEEAMAFTGFERLSSASVFINELMVVTNPFQIFDRYVELINYLQNDPDLKGEITAYFRSIGFTPERLIFHVASIFINNVVQDVPEEYLYLYNLPDSPEDRKDAESIFRFLSRRGLVDSLQPMDISEIKKSPLYFDKFKDKYLLFDCNLLAEKVYDMFINDFWFDHMKTKMNIKKYRAIIGKFFEEYCYKVLHESYVDKPQYTLKSGKDLLVISSKGQDELTDSILVQEDNVCIFEFKSTGVYTDQKQSTELSLYRDDPDQFYKYFGIFQIADGILNLRDRPAEFKVELETKTFLNIFPVLVVNEKIAMNPYIVGILNEKLKELLKSENFGNSCVNYLTVFHISDLETLCSGVHISNLSIYDVCKSNSLGAIFPRPVGVTMNRLGIKNKNRMLFPWFAGFKPGLSEALSQNF